MNIDHIQFCVDDAQAWAAWFEYTLHFRRVGEAMANHTQVAIVESGNIRFVLLSPLSDRSPLAVYCRQHPMGVVDVAFQVNALDQAIAQAQAHGAIILQPPQCYRSAVGHVRWAVCQGWGDLRHTLVERRGVTPIWVFLDGLFKPGSLPAVEDLTATLTLDDRRSPTPPLTAIDHVVLNVAHGDLNQAIARYEDWFGFRRQQAFTIQTPRSGLCSQVLVHPEGTAQLPINEPTSDTSQIQEFLICHRGAGIQHIALETPDILGAIAQLRQRGLPFIPVPPTYYAQLQRRPDCYLTPAQHRAIAQAEILVDWQTDDPTAILWQTFTQPIFEMPTFFFEIIQRRTLTPTGNRHAEGFGEGNFRALFEAIEREQLKRTSVTRVPEF